MQVSVAVPNSLKTFMFQDTWHSNKRTIEENIIAGLHRPVIRADMVTIVRLNMVYFGVTNDL